MTRKPAGILALLAALLAATLGAGSASAQGDAYATILGGYHDSELIGGGAAGQLLLGQRFARHAIEGGASFAAPERGEITGGNLNLLFYPSVKMPSLFALLGVGGQELKRGQGAEGFSAVAVQLGLGIQWGVRWRRSFRSTLRLEAVLVHLEREENLSPARDDLPVARRFDDMRFSIGLQVPLGRPQRDVAPPDNEPPVVTSPLR